MLEPEIWTPFSEEGGPSEFIISKDGLSKCERCKEMTVKRWRGCLSCAIEWHRYGYVRMNCNDEDHMWARTHPCCDGDNWRGPTADLEELFEIEEGKVDHDPPIDSAQKSQGDWVDEIVQDPDWRAVPLETPKTPKYRCQICPEILKVMYKKMKRTEPGEYKEEWTNGGYYDPNWPKEICQYCYNKVQKEYRRARKWVAYQKKEERAIT